MARSKIKKAPRTSTSPRKAVTTAEKSRAAPRCSQCDGKPLRSECVHTVKGRMFLSEKEAAAHLVTSMSTQHQGQTSRPFPELPDGNPFIFSQPQVTHTDVQSPARPSVTSQTSHTPSSQATGSDGEVRRHIYDPIFLGLGPDPTPAVSPSASSANAQLLTTPRPASPRASSVDHQSPEDTNASGRSIPSDTPCTSPASRRITGGSQSSSRVRATASRPIYGSVKGVLRGNMPHNIFRKHKKGVPITESRKSAKTFLQNVHGLIEKCEDIATMTGAWLFIGAQHPTASGLPINYASPRLRRDGGALSNTFATDFLKLISKVQEGKRADVLEIQKQLDEEREAKDQVQAQLDDQRDENVRIQAELEEARARAERNEREINEVRRTLASLGDTTSSV